MGKEDVYIRIKLKEIEKITYCQPDLLNIVVYKSESTMLGHLGVKIIKLKAET